MDRGAWRATKHGITESDLTEQLTFSLFHFHNYIVSSSLVSLSLTQPKVNEKIKTQKKHSS